MGAVFKGGTQTKTYSLFVEDVAKLKASGTTAKHIFRLGIMALENNPRINLRIGELEAQNEALVEKIRKYAQRLYDLEKQP